MSKQIYIDSNGNEVQVSGTVNSADMLPIEAGSSKMTADAIGDLSQLTTSDKSSLVGAVNEVANIIDISTSFTKGASVTGDFFVRAYYNKGTKRVSGVCSVNVTSGSISTSQAFMYVTSAYRPQYGYELPMMVKTSSGFIPYKGGLNTGGDFTQHATSTATGVYMYFEYYI